MVTIHSVPQRKVKYLFIDGGYFRKIIKDFDKVFEDLFSEPGEINYNSLRSSHRKVFYYDCLPVRKTERKKTEKLFNKLRSLPGFHVYEGKLRGKRTRQKRVDVLIAVHMFEHSINRNMEELTFIAGDDDFVPLIESLVRLGIYVTLLYQKGSVSNDLLYAADDGNEINIDMIYDWKEEKYRKKFSLPNRFISAPPAFLKKSKVVRKGIYLDKKITLFKTPENVYVLIRELNSRNEIYAMSHIDKNILLKYFKIREGEIKWQK